MSPSHPDARTLAGKRVKFPTGLIASGVCILSPRKCSREEAEGTTVAWLLATLPPS